METLKEVWSCTDEEIGRMLWKGTVKSTVNGDFWTVLIGATLAFFNPPVLSVSKAKYSGQSKTHLAGGLLLRKTKYDRFKIKNQNRKQNKKKQPTAQVTRARTNLISWNGGICGRTLSTLVKSTHHVPLLKSARFEFYICCVFDLQIRSRETTPAHPPHWSSATVLCPSRFASHSNSLQHTLLFFCFGHHPKQKNRVASFQIEM